MITNAVRVDGFASIRLEDHSIADIETIGYFEKYGRYFFVHRDVNYPDEYTVSEASTGARITGDTYLTFEDALYFAEKVIDYRRYYFATSCANIIVPFGSLMSRNINIQTLAINSLLW